MFSIYNNSKFESFTELINHSFNVRTKEELIKILYEYLPKIFGGDIFIFLPVLLQENEVELEVPEFTELDKERELAALEIKKYYYTGNKEFPAIINDWFVMPVKIKSEIVFLFAVENKAMEKLSLQEEQKENILTVVANLIFRIDTLEDETKRNIKLEKEKLRTQILSSVSHDLKTPLAAIIGSLSILTSSNAKITDDQKRDLIETSVSEAHRLNNFITNILNMARIESGVIKSKMEWHNVEDVVKHIEKRFKVKYPERVLRTQEIPGYLNFNTDPTLFEQIMMVILDNATKYSPPETEIELSVEKDAMLDFVIKDYGKGIPENMQDKIFDKYTRLQMQDRKIAGTGLGLAIAKSLADLQNMNIIAYNHEKGGAMFKISCPEWKI